MKVCAYILYAILMASLWSSLVESSLTRKLIYLTIFSVLSISTMAEEQQVWLNPCGVHHVEEVRMRHRNQEAIKLISKQLKLTIDNLKYVNRTEISKTYRSVHNITRQIEDHNLPSAQMRHFRSYRLKHPKMNKERMIQYAFPRLYARLQTYAVAFVKLSSMVPHTDSSKPIQSKRSHIINGVIQNLKGLVCEVQTGINTTSAIMPKYVEQAAFRSDKSWPANPDLTNILTRDMSIFREYRTFLEDWQKIIREVDAIGRENRTKVGPNKKNPDRRRKRGNRRKLNPRPRPAANS